MNETREVCGYSWEGMLCSHHANNVHSCNKPRGHRFDHECGRNCKHTADI